MSHFDEEQARLDALTGIAVTIALQTGLLEQCRLHEEVYDPLQHDYEAAYKLGNYLITNSDPRHLLRLRRLLLVVREKCRKLTRPFCKITPNYLLQ